MATFGWPGKSTDFNRSPGAMSIRSMSKWNRFLGRSEEQPMDQWTGRSSVFLTRAMFCTCFLHVQNSLVRSSKSTDIALEMPTDEKKQPSVISAK